jgi:adenylyltransferase/sulfurtransferase
VGQAKLLGSRVLVIGAGGLGSPLLMYLAAAGVGTLGVVDDDQVTLSNLQRQVIHTSDRLGAPKTESAAETLAALNPDVEIVSHPERFEAHNALGLIADYDLVADGSDNFATRFLVNDACFIARKTLVSAALLRFDGQLSVFKAHQGGDNPCYRCIYREPPPEGMIPTCAEGGVLGALAGAMGSLQATEVVKELLGIGKSLSGSRRPRHHLPQGARAPGSGLSAVRGRGDHQGSLAPCRLRKREPFPTSSLWWSSPAPSRRSTTPSPPPPRRSRSTVR